LSFLFKLSSSSSQTPLNPSIHPSIYLSLFSPQSFFGTLKAYFSLDGWMEMAKRILVSEERLSAFRMREKVPVCLFLSLFLLLSLFIVCFFLFLYFGLFEICVFVVFGDFGSFSV
jgi:hypothetical protein